MLFRKWCDLSSFWLCVITTAKDFQKYSFLWGVWVNAYLNFMTDIKRCVCWVRAKYPISHRGSRSCLSQRLSCLEAGAASSWFEGNKNLTTLCNIWVTKVIAIQAPKWYVMRGSETLIGHYFCAFSLHFLTFCWNLASSSLDRDSEIRIDIFMLSVWKAISLWYCVAGLFLVAWIGSVSSQKPKARTQLHTVAHFHTAARRLCFGWRFFSVSDVLIKLSWQINDSHLSRPN